jgi:hypothetical protein
MTGTRKGAIESEHDSSPIVRNDGIAATVNAIAHKEQTMKRSIGRWVPAAAAAAIAFATPGGASAANASCHVESGPRTAALVELYTSEGCDSCPPADRWLSRHVPVGAGGDTVALAFHVDYWDRLGWKDRFASAAHTERQYDVMRMNGQRFVYTPQVLVGGHAFDDWRSGSPSRAIAAINTRSARARIAIDATVNGSDVAIVARTTVDNAPGDRNASLAVALADNGLVSDVKSGENAGARLAHDHVVRHFASGFKVAQGAARAVLDWRLPEEAGRSPAIVAFVQDANGDILQAVTLPLAACTSAR